MEILNVLIKGIEVKDINFCQAFTNEVTVNKWIEEICLKNKWIIKSRMGWNDDNTIDDRRVEDEKGNTYYFVIYKQLLNN